jgi:hypothetical protein
VAEDKTYDEDHESEACEDHGGEGVSQQNSPGVWITSITPDQAKEAGRNVGSTVRLMLDNQKALREGFLSGLLEVAEGDETHVEIGGVRMTTRQYEASTVHLRETLGRLKAENDRLQNLARGFENPSGFTGPDVPCTPWVPEFSEDEEPTVSAAARQALGAASVCWDEKGMFLSERANWIADGLLAFVDEHYREVEHAFFPEDKAYEVLGLFTDDTPAMEQWERAERVGQVVNGWLASVRKGWGTDTGQGYETPPIEPTITDSGAPGLMPEDFEAALGLVCEQCGAPIGQWCDLSVGGIESGNPALHAIRLQMAQGFKPPLPSAGRLLDETKPTIKTLQEPDVEWGGGEGVSDEAPGRKTMVYVGTIMDLTADVDRWLRERIPEKAARVAARQTSASGVADGNGWIESLAWVLARKIEEASL